MAQIATTVEQSRKLMELGLDPVTADMLWGYYYNGENHCVPNIRPFRDGRNEVPSGYSPAWSLQALLNLIPKTHKFKNAFREYTKSGKIIWCFWCHAISEYTFEGDSDFECIFNIIVWLLENNLIIKSLSRG